MLWLQPAELKPIQGEIERIIIFEGPPITKCSSEAHAIDLDWGEGSVVSRLFSGHPTFTSLQKRLVLAFVQAAGDSNTECLVA